MQKGVRVVRRMTQTEYDKIMSEIDSETSSHISYILDSLKVLKQIRQCGNCFNCANRDCGYLPKHGRPIRYNCPFYKPDNFQAEKDDEKDNVEVPNVKNDIAEELKKCKSVLVKKTNTISALKNTVAEKDRDIESLSAEIIKLKAKTEEPVQPARDQLKAYIMLKDLEEQVEKYKLLYENTILKVKDFEKSLNKAETKLKELGYETNGEDYVKIEVQKERNNE